MKEMVLVGVKIPAELDHALETLSFIKKRTKSQIVADSLNLYGARFLKNLKAREAKKSGQDK